MADYTLTAAPPLAGYDESFGTIRLRAPAHVALVSVALPLGGEAAAARAITAAYGTALPPAGKAALSKDGTATLMGMAPDQAFVLFTREEPDACEVVADKIGDVTYLTDQTDVWCALEISGVGCRAALERICAIDLHPDAFAVLDVARTVMEHLGAIVLRTDEDSFLLLSASSSADSFLHAVETSARNVS